MFKLIATAMVSFSFLAGLATAALSALDGAWLAEGNQAHAYFGTSVSTAGDVNGDGFSDVIIGSPLYDGPASESGRIFVYHGSAAGLSPVENWKHDGPAHLDLYGTSVSSAGDVNGDGYDDVIAGAPENDDGGINAGKVHVFHGGPGGLGAPSHTSDGTQIEAQWGAAVAYAGDVNGDGYADVLVGSPRYDDAFPDGGMVTLLYGSPTGVSLSGSWSFVGNAHGMWLGWSVATAGDVNADGFSDFVVGAPGSDLAYVFLGGPTGPAAVPAAILNGPSGSDWGISVATAGDVNGDGYADVAIGAPEQSDGLIVGGMAHVFHGSVTGVSTSPDWQYAGLENLDQVGTAVATAGDVNGDGYADLLVGAREAGDLNGEGRSHLFYGSATGLQSTPVWVAEGEQQLAFFGSALSTAGDVNGDGHSDILVAGPWAGNTEEREGRVGVWHGRPDAPSFLADWGIQMSQDFAELGNALCMGDFNGDGYADVGVASTLFNGAAGTDAGAVWCFDGGHDGAAAAVSFATEGMNPGDNLGHDIANAGDVNNDGYDDLLVSAIGFDHGRGEVTLYLGSATGIDPTAAWIQRGENSGDEYGWSVAGCGDLNGDGYADIAIGAPSAPSSAPVGKVYVYFGSESGPSVTADWIGVGEQEICRFGFDVDTAGDVDGDGFWELLIGAPNCRMGDHEGGAAYVYFGSEQGPSANPWIGLPEQGGIEFGAAVAPAGDVNGDGLGDIVVGAPLYDLGGNNNEGAAFIHLGKPGTLEDAAIQRISVSHPGAQLGTSVASSDFDNDGYSDIVVGLPFVDNGQPEEGQIRIYRGPFDGSSLDLYWGADGNEAFSYFGQAVATGGDVTGDGFPDLLASSTGFGDIHVNEGAAWVFPGNGNGPSLDNQLSHGLDRRPATTQTLGGPLAFRGQSEFGTGIGMIAHGRTALGRGVVSLEVEVKPYGQAFDGTGTWISSRTDTGMPVPGIGSRSPLEVAVEGLDPGTLHRWRARIVSQDPMWKGSPWFTAAGNSQTQTDFRTSPSTSDAPELGSADADGKRITASPSATAFQTSLSFSVATNGDVELAIFDPGGRRIRTLWDGPIEAGTHAVDWNTRDDQGRSTPSGVYFAVLQTAQGTWSDKVIVAR